MKQGISDIPHAREGSRDKCYHSTDHSSQQKMLYRETPRTHPGCSECTCLITVVPTQIRKGLTLQATSRASSRPSPSYHNQTSLAAPAWGWASTAVTYHREPDFCPRAQLPLSFLRRGRAVNKCGKRHLVGSAAVVGILPEKTTDWREADQTPPLDCSELNEVRNSVLGSISLKQNREQQTRQCDSFFLDIQQ